MEPTLEEIKDNLFPEARAAIKDWNAFPWHRWRGSIQSNKQRSSQALAIDVFGTIKMSPERDRILGALAQHCGLPADGPWALELEWVDPKNLLGESRPTQVDVILFGKRALLVIECKFAEPGGTCSQPGRQCSGDYLMQTNPENGIASRCALTGKRIKYWEFIPEIFGLDPERDYRPCPFAGDAYQWMRNVVLANQLAADRGVSGAVIAAYAEGDGLPIARKARSDVIGHAPASGTKLVFPLSYQTIVGMARSVSAHPELWDALAEWIARKIRSVQRSAMASEN